MRMSWWEEHAYVEQQEQENRLPVGVSLSVIAILSVALWYGLAQAILWLADRL